MGRPAKSVSVQSKHLTEEEKAARQETEKRLQGKKDKIKPLKHLTKEQKKIFTTLKAELAAADILSNLDIYILSTCAIAIDRLAFIESKMNTDHNLIADKDYLAAKDKYTKDLYRCSSELCLSPQSRAKIGKLATEAKKENPLLSIVSHSEE